MFWYQFVRKLPSKVARHKGLPCWNGVVEIRAKILRMPFYS